MRTRKKKVVKSSLLRRFNIWGNVFVLPFCIVFLIFSVYPVLRTLFLSFTDLRVMGDYKMVGLENYIRVVTDKFFWRALRNTVRIWSVNIVLQLGMAFILMMIFSDVKYKVKGLRLFRVIYYLPNLIAATSVAFLFQTILDWRFGTFNIGINTIAKIFGLSYNPINWLGSTVWAPITIAIIQSWMWFGNSFLVLMAGVQGIPGEYFEVASLDGANRFQIFTNITLPLIRPILMYVAITSLIGGLQMFDIPFLLEPPTSSAYQTTETVMMYLYKFGFTAGSIQTGYASAIAYVLFLIILVVSIGQLMLFRRKED
ncbi:MAG: sugar ABC transporter permease [Eubacterium sp.]|nr:sugar ABC transporter permease [Eubacterium sp.]